MPIIVSRAHVPGRANVLALAATLTFVAFAACAPDTGRETDAAGGGPDARPGAAGLQARLDSVIGASGAEVVGVY